MSFKKITDNCFFLPGAINVGLIINENTGIIIDSGMDKDAARKIAKALDELKVNPVAIINTHSHADHCGGNVHLQKRYPEIRIYASALEKALIEQPYYEGFYLFGGGEPPKEMQNKFLKAEPSKVDFEINEGVLEIAALKLEAVALPGHTAGQMGIKFQNVFFTADAFFGSDIVTKYGVPYFTDINATLHTLNLLAEFKGTVVPCHGAVSENFIDDIDRNHSSIEQTCNIFKRALKQALTENDLVNVLTETFNLQLKNLSQYYLSRSTVMAYLSFFVSTNDIEYELIDGRLFWKAK